MNQNSYMYGSMLSLANDECNSLIKSDDSSAQVLYLKCLALIIVSRMRCFLRGKSEIEVYKFTQELSALKNKIRANERHILARLILEYI